MPPLELPIKCENCGSEELVHGLKFGKLNSLMSNVGGPGQEPPPLGNQWAVYLCLQCDAILPFRKHYAAQPQIQAQYDKIYKLCKTRIERNESKQEETKSMESINEASKVLASLPIGYQHKPPASYDLLLQKIENLESEIRRRRGGRPKKGRV